MSVLRFSALPLPHYIRSGYSLAGPGRKHPERCAIGEFDLLVVKTGCMYIGEEDRRYEVAEGHALILRPDLHHYPTESCRELTGSFWLHFQTEGSWTTAEDDEDGVGSADRFAGFSNGRPEGRVPAFSLRLPQFTRLTKPTRMYELLQQLNTFEGLFHLDAVRWKQQLLFQEVLEILADSLADLPPQPPIGAADLAASYLRLHYREDVTARDLGTALNFHPVYIARCMQKQFGCSPTEYLLRYRLEQAKLLLLQTDLSIGRIAAAVGFQQAAYFTACFRKWGGESPREYRRRMFNQQNGKESRMMLRKFSANVQE
ncbi:helix-turn-helix transcriptional regulator [Gorillibacterium massiliense]|uniref:helix-turn-helix transcriptional regulator n=1 Tax=Gorillibacterium massiliense TaxID=1280390 RepID=UPI0004B25FD8|nr:helix-turn-helix domain-containing protein [Gorillibacterium massiliense]